MALAVEDVDLVMEHVAALASRDVALVIDGMTGFFDRLAVARSLDEKNKLFVMFLACVKKIGNDIKSLHVLPFLLQKVQITGFVQDVAATLLRELTADQEVLKTMDNICPHIFPVLLRVLEGEGASPLAKKYVLFTLGDLSLELRGRLELRKFGARLIPVCSDIFRTPPYHLSVLRSAAKILASFVARPKSDLSARIVRDHLLIIPNLIRWLNQNDEFITEYGLFVLGFLAMEPGGLDLMAPCSRLVPMLVELVRSGTPYHKHYADQLLRQLLMSNAEAQAEMWRDSDNALPLLSLPYRRDPLPHLGLIQEVIVSALEKMGEGAPTSRQKAQFIAAMERGCLIFPLQQAQGRRVKTLSVQARAWGLVPRFKEELERSRSGRSVRASIFSFAGLRVAAHAGVFLSQEQLRLQVELAGSSSASGYHPLVT